MSRRAEKVARRYAAVTKVPKELIRAAREVLFEMRRENPPEDKDQVEALVWEKEGDTVLEQVIDEVLYPELSEGKIPWKQEAKVSGTLYEMVAEVLKKKNYWLGDLPRNPFKYPGKPYAKRTRVKMGLDKLLPEILRRARKKIEVWVKFPEDLYEEKDGGALLDEDWISRLEWSYRDLVERSGFGAIFGEGDDWEKEEELRDQLYTAVMESYRKGR